jgi:hypothetical protein
MPPEIAEKAFLGLGVLLLMVELAILYGPIQRKFSFDSQDKRARFLNERHNLDLPIENQSWKQIVITASIMTPMVLGCFGFAIWFAV